MSGHLLKTKSALQSRTSLPRKKPYWSSGGTGPPTSKAPKCISKGISLVGGRWVSVTAPRRASLVREWEEPDTAGSPGCAARFLLFPCACLSFSGLCPSVSPEEWWRRNSKRP